MVRIIANAIESGYDAEVPTRSDVDPEMQKVGLGHQTSAGQGRAPCTALAVTFVLVRHLRRSTLSTTRHHCCSCSTSSMRALTSPK
jgi:hypothetical protein